MDDKVNYLAAFNFQNSKEVIANILGLPLFKSAFASLATLATWLFGANTSMIWAILSLLVADTISGFIRRIKSGEISAKGFFKFANKSIIYLVILAIASLVDKAIPAPFALSIVASFLAVTEGISTLENLGKMGFPIPKTLMDKLEAMKPDARSSDDKKPK